MIKRLKARSARQPVLQASWGLSLALVLLVGNMGPSWGFDTMFERVTGSLDDLMQSAESGDLVSQYDLGLVYLKGVDAPKDYPKALKWFGRAAESGLADAQLALGIMFDLGLGVDSDSLAAVKWFRLAAEQGNAEAQSNLGYAYEFGKGVDKSLADAVTWYKLSAEGKSARGQYNLGQLYAEGKGLERDIVLASILFARAAKQGFRPAQDALDSPSFAFKVGLSYYQGESHSKDYKTAFKWFSRSADSQFVEAQVLLGQMYYKGEGVDQDKVKAFEWFKLAAQQGSAYAQIKLGSGYAFGEGVAQSLVFAYMWFRVAAHLGDRRGDHLQKALEPDMTSSQISRAKEIAQECIAMNYKGCSSVSAN